MTARNRTTTQVAQFRTEKQLVKTQRYEQAKAEQGSVQEVRDRATTQDCDADTTRLKKAL